MPVLGLKKRAVLVTSGGRTKAFHKGRSRKVAPLLLAVECTRLLMSLLSGVQRSMKHLLAPHLRPEAATNFPHTPAHHHHRLLRHAVKGGSGTIHPGRTGLQPRFGLTSSATPYPLPQPTQDSSLPARADPLPCHVSVPPRITLFRTAVAPG